MRYTLALLLVLVSTSCATAVDDRVWVEVGVANLDAGKMIAIEVDERLGRIGFSLRKVEVARPCEVDEVCSWRAFGLMPRSLVDALNDYEDEKIRVEYVHEATSAQPLLAP